MKILKLIQKLKTIHAKHGDIEIHFSGPNGDQEPYSVKQAEVVVAEDGEYPEDYNMPKGYTFVQLTN